jgi:hypothetical protein
MRNRFGLGMLLLVGLVLPFVGCGSSTDVDSIIVSPSDVSLSSGTTAQLTAIGSIGHGKHPTGSRDVTGFVTWSSSIKSVATVSATGEVTAVSAGTTSITASMLGFGGIITSNAVNVTVTGGGGGSQLLKSLAIIPGSQTVPFANETTQFIAIGTTESGATQDLTGQAKWSSSSTQIARISVGGLATALNQGTTTITAIATNSDKTVVTGTATFTVTGGASEPFTAITISPGAQALSATGQTGQFIAFATSGSSGVTTDVTNSAQVTWTSSIPSIATVSTYPTTPAGQVAGVSAGTTTITAKLTNPDGSVVSATANITVTASAAPEPLLSIVVLPNIASIGNLDGTAQFLAYGTFSTAPTVMDITNGINHLDGFTSKVTWISAPNQNVFPVNSAGADGETGGLVTAYGSGSADIYVVATNPDGTLVYSPPATFNCPLVPYVPATATAPAVLGSCNEHTIAPPLLVTLTVFNAGLNTTNWLITADSATGTKDVIHCGPGSTSGGSVCVATYPLGSTITLTAPAQTGVAFGGWSFNCTDTAPVTAAGPNSCTVTLGTGTSSNVSVGAVFN